MDRELIRRLFRGLDDIDNLEWYTSRKMRSKLVERGLVTTDKRIDGLVRRRLTDYAKRLLESIELEVKERNNNNG